MRKTASLAAVAAFMLLIPTSGQSADISAGLSISDGHLKSFHLAISDYFKLPEREVIAVRERKIPDEELAVIFYLSQRAGVTPQAVIELRKAGKSYLEITLLFQLSPAIYYVPIKKDPGPPFGKAYGHFKKRSKSEWKKVELDDDDIVNLVNLRFISNHCHASPDDVISLRAKSKSYVLLHDETIQYVAESKKKSDAPKARNFADRNKGPKPK